MSEIDLKSIIKETAEVEEEFPGYDGFVITLRYPGRKELTAIRKESSVQRMNRRTGRVEEELDEDKFLKSYVKSVISGWKGFKVSYLQELALVDTEGLDPDDEIPFSIDNAVILMQNSPMFDTWISELSTDFENFTKAK